MTAEQPPSRVDDHPATIRRVTGGRHGIVAHLREVVESLFVGYFLVTRDVKIRYRQTVLGIAWVVIQPVAFGLVLALFVGRLAKVPTDGQPYGAFFIAGLVSWTYLSSAVEASTNSLVQDINLVTKVYIPRLLIPLAAVSSYALDLLIAAVVATAYALIVGVDLSWRIAVLIPACGWAALLAASIGVLFGSLNVKYRDVRAVVRFGVQIWLFVTPVAYSWTAVPVGWRTVYGLNPAVGVVTVTRWSILAGTTPPTGMLAASLATTVLVALVALKQFDRLERQFADAI